MNSRSKILATVSLVCLMSIAPLHTASASEAEILTQLRILQQRLDKQAKEIAELRGVEKTQAREIKLLSYESDKLFSKAKKAKSSEDNWLESAYTNEALSNEALFNVGMSEDGVIDAIFENIEDHETNAHASRVKIGGWMDFMYVDRNSPGFKRYMDPSHLYLFFDAKLDDNWRTYIELEFEHTPFQEHDDEGKGEIKMERLYIEYNHDDFLNARFGKFYTPLGLWTREHWGINVPSIQKVIHQDNGYVPTTQVGVEGFGGYFSQSENKLAPDIDYNIWVSQGTEVFGTNDPDDDKFAYGANIYGTFDDKLILGLSVYSQTDSGVKEKTLHPYVKVDLPHRVTLTGEYLSQRRGGGNSDIDAWYASAQWWFHDKAYVYYRRDQGDDVKNSAAGNSDKHEGNIFTLGYWPRNYVRTKFEFGTHNFDDPADEDYNQWAASIGIVF